MSQKTPIILSVLILIVAAGLYLANITEAPDVPADSGPREDNRAPSPLTGEGRERTSIAHLPGVWV